MEKTLTNRYDFLYIFDVQRGNPNGDPDVGNLPRTDEETGQGLVTDVCLKRKIRNYVEFVKEDSDGYKIFVKEKAVLNDIIDEACADPAVLEVEGEDKKVATAQTILCSNYWDIRTFGAVMSTGKRDGAGAKNGGQITGPVQLTFAESVDPIRVQDFAITRMAVTKKEDAKKERAIGRKALVPYGLYVCKGYVSPGLAEKTGFGEEDLTLLWEALGNMFDNDRSAARGDMAACRLIVFKHNSKLGNAPARKLFNLVKIARKQDVSVPRSYDDYDITIDRGSCPKGVEILDIL